MCDAISHRGPDEEGFWHSDRVSVGVRRLSIIDIPGGTQPVWVSPHHGIIFNGEIYNYRSLRKRLQEQGHVFSTLSDTEVILRLYQQEGIDFLSHLNGMFAICLMDLERGEVILARDRFGEKPLYYTNQSGCFYFASEIKALASGMPSMPALNQEALSHYLTLRFVPPPLTMWQGIHKLPPGQFITYDLNSRAYKTDTYWSLDFKAAPGDARRDYRSEFRDLFLPSVHQRILASDVPVGIMLSGGLDSALITLAAKESGHNSLHTFSIGYSDNQHSELGYAAQVAKYFGTQHHEVQYTQADFLDHLPDYIWDMDEPMGDSASIPLRHLCGFARGKVKVALTGEGADEMCGGYDLDHLARASDRYRRLFGWTPPRAFHLAALMQGRNSSRGRAFTTMAREGWGAYLTAGPDHPTNFWTEAEKNQLFPGLTTSRPTADLIRDWYRSARSPEPLDKYMSVMAQGWLTEDLLMKADKMSMRESLELRCPFLDYPLTEWAQQLPLEARVGNGRKGYTTKAALRHFGTNRLPEEILQRPKQGFPVPTYVWIHENLDKWLSLLQAPDSALRTRLGFHTGPAWGQQFRNTQGEYGLQKLWLLILLELWARRWLLEESREEVSKRIHKALG